MGQVNVDSNALAIRLSFFSSCHVLRYTVFATPRITVASLSYKATNEPVLQHRRGSRERQKLDNIVQSMLSKSPHEVPICIGSEELTSSDQRKQVLPFRHSHTFANFYYASEQQIKSAICAALKARESWSRTEFDIRARIFLKAADMISDQNRFQLLASTILGQAKTIFQAEIDAAAELADFLRFNVQFASDALKYKPIDTPDARNRVIYRPTEGFWAAIPPFNFTAIAGNLASAPALMGNVVLWKPSDSAVYSNYLVYRVFREAGLPSGVINFVPADGPTFGSVVTRHPQLAGVNFTGSTRTFRTILKEISKNLDHYRGYPRAIGECGGKNYHLIHPSADLNEAALATIRSAFEYSGQKCSACSRLYVPASLWSRMKSLLLEHHRQLKVGSPLDPDTFTSAVIDQTAFRKISGYLDYAKSCPDIEVIAGGNADGTSGYFIEPTILLTKNPTDKIMKDDIFGPIVCAYVYNDDQVDQVMDLVDSTTDYALTGSIFAKDERFIQRATDRLIDTTGNFYVNVQSTGSVVGQQPFGGARLSGTNDKAGGPQYALRFTSPLSIKTQKAPISSWKQQHME
ncbi:Delta-1-pyrroline-5-carboxylate dehydrogenase mitochondrial [Fasciola gigantica]|uniref:Multifunctional fusion protein n=1 Tax=Fasciola gigantica TaxID=46835 RepID=A0A504YWX7_FASGI|nr:Delta-1-pyrroline-5-carboxylate dehydrogenase mitochondrial [Fasciola gigantica]